MNDIAVRTFTEWGMKRIEIYPFGDKGFQAHIDIDFVLLDKEDVFHFQNQSLFESLYRF